MYNKNHISSTFIKPFIRWAGGKQYLVKYILPHLPINKFNKYFEPFLGAGSLFFAGSFNNSILSDINTHLINSYIAIKENPLKIYSLLHNFKKRLTREFYYQIRNTFNKNINELSLSQAARFIFLIHTSFNGIYRVNKNGYYNVPFGKISPNLPSKEHLIRISKKLEHVKLKTGNYSIVDSMIKKGDLVYLDPPYPPINGTSNFQHYTIDKFPNGEQEKVALFANRLSRKGAYVLISNADTKYIRSLYKRWKIVELQVTRYISCKSKRNKITELIIKNY